MTEKERLAFAAGCVGVLALLVGVVTFTAGDAVNSSSTTGIVAIGVAVLCAAAVGYLLVKNKGGLKVLRERAHSLISDYDDDDDDGYESDPDVSEDFKQRLGLRST